MVPNGVSDAAIAGTATETVTVSTNEAVGRPDARDANATLAVTGASGPATLSVWGGLTATAVKAISVTSYGTLSLAGGSTTLDGFTLALGSLRRRRRPTPHVGTLETDRLPERGGL